MQATFLYWTCQTRTKITLWKIRKKVKPYLKDNPLKGKTITWTIMKLTETVSINFSNQSTIIAATIITIIKAHKIQTQTY